ncbi:hypothetical protein H3H37_24110 [Duganella sp. LX20W]|uniref:Uncharacterized protein n=1 Tax=Rugamonas brunnea TaxID=2758569 RepID=A0A7W2IEK2_9BURK|nr:hypothetical protein [Rugamonas brunnea]MBA5640152.1 hypothetical protein [Rugamonas brunnea]
MTRTSPTFFRHMEDALIVEFSKKADRRFRELHGAGKAQPYLVGSALCGQDKALADYLFAAGGRFALIEFKANAEQLKTEGAKPQRVRLLADCIGDSARLARSRAIHHAAWGESAQLDLPGLGAQTQQELVLGHYVDRVGTALGLAVPKLRTVRWSDDAFIARWLENTIAGANIQRFKRYLTELYELVGTDGVAGLADFQGLITVYVPAGERRAQFQTITFNSFEHLLALTIHYTPQRAPEQSAPTAGRAPRRDNDGPQYER